MTSTVTDYSNLIDATYPVAGINNDTQGFRNNFAAIKSAFTNTANEISSLQIAVSAISPLEALSTITQVFSGQSIVASQSIRTPVLNFSTGSLELNSDTLIVKGPKYVTISSNNTSTATIINMFNSGTWPYDNNIQLSTNTDVSTLIGATFQFPGISTGTYVVTGADTSTNTVTTTPFNSTELFNQGITIGNSGSRITFYKSIGGTFVGNLVGNVTGNVAGIVTATAGSSLIGNVTGNIKGIVTATTGSSLIGVVTATAGSSLIGNVRGIVTATTGSSLIGNVTGNVIGDVTGTVYSSTGTVIIDNILNLGVLNGLTVKGSINVYDTINAVTINGALSTATLQNITSFGPLYRMGFRSQSVNDSTTGSISVSNNTMVIDGVNQIAFSSTQTYAAVVTNIHWNTGNPVLYVNTLTLQSVTGINIGDSFALYPGENGQHFVKEVNTVTNVITTDSFDPTNAIAYYAGSTGPFTITFKQGQLLNTLKYVVKAPTSSVGATGDKKGMVFATDSYVYICYKDYVDNSTNIWARVATTGASW